MFEDFAKYMTDRRFSPATIKLRITYARRFEAFQIDRTGTFDPSTVSTADLTAYIISNPDWKPATQQTIVASLRTFFRWARLTGLVDTNPADNLDPIRIPRTPARIAPDDTIILALRRGSIAEQTMLRLGAECGLRVAEIAALRCSCRNGRWLCVVGKGGVTRNVYTSPELAALLDQLEYQRMGDYYFPGKDRHGHTAPSTVWRHVRDLTQLNTHSLRHRAGTTVYRNTGHDLRLAQTFLGHASPTTTAVYVHIEDDDLMRAAEAARLCA